MPNPDGGEFTQPLPPSSMGFMLQVIFMPLNCHPVRQLPRAEVERPLEGLLEGPLLRDAGPAPRALQAHIHLRRGQEKRERYVGKIMLGLGFEIELLGLVVDSERSILHSLMSATKPNRPISKLTHD